MDGQGLQAIRSEIEAIVAFQAALNRLALTVDENALTEWSGPRPEEIDGLVSDDGTFYRDELIEVRKRAGEALATRFREVAAVTRDRPQLSAILGKALATGTGGVASLEGPEAGGVLAALTRTGAIRLDWAESAAALVRDELEKLSAPEKPKAKPQGKASTKAPRAKEKAKKKAPAAKQKPVKRAQAKAPRAPAKRAKAVSSRKASTRKKSPAKKAVTKKAAPRKKR